MRRATCAALERIPLLLGAGVCFLLLAACEPKVEKRGFVAEDITTAAAKIASGASRTEVLHALGSPSTVSHFGGENWYYIASRKEGVAFFKPEVTAQQVMKIEFDTEGRVREIHHFDESDSENIRYAKDITPTEGHSLGFMEQILGNLGKFNKQRDAAAE